MKIVIAVDSFKGSITSLQAGNAVKEGILRVLPNASTVVYPLADGGEGSVEALVEGMKGKYKEVEVLGPSLNKVIARYGILGNKAIIEMASASGITLVEGKKNPMYATTYGVGQIILDALNNGCRDFIIGIGGSATNDGGVGMLQALGYHFLDRENKEIKLGAIGLNDLVRINDNDIDVRLQECNFNIACDVNNPLCGINGASYIFGPQKGADIEMVEKLDKLLKHYSIITKTYIPKADNDYPGTGAAGGLGYALYNYLNANLTSGIDLIINTINIEKDIKDADLIITGEGKLDKQTAMGKAPIGISKIAKKYHKPVIAIAGCVTEDAKILNQEGIDAYFPIVRGIMTIEEAMNYDNACNNMTDTVEQIMRIINIYKE